MYNLAYRHRIWRNYPPANTFGEPAATEVHPDIASPTLPVPTLLVLTVVDPVAIGAACGGHGTPGNRCVVLLSPCLETGMLFAKTFGEPTALVMPVQCVTSASPILVTAGIVSLPFH